MTGSDLDEATKLYFSDSKIKAERLPDPPPPKDKKKDNNKKAPPPPRFRVTVPGGLKTSCANWGRSNARAPWAARGPVT